jgi:allantoinase
MTDLVVRSERVVFHDGVRPAAIHVEDERIAAIAPYSEKVAGVRVLDAGGLMVLPGLVDAHVHMNDPGRGDWEGVEHATRAAAAAGVTTLVDMPLNSVPATTTIEGLEAKRDAVGGRAHVDVGLWGGVVPGNAADLEPLARAGILGFKCFLSPSGVDEFGHVSEQDLRTAMPELARLNLPLLAHAELPADLIDRPSGDPRSYATWLACRPPAAEHHAIEMLIGMAAEYGVHVHIVHLASADALPALRAARARGVRVTVETCPHYLTFAAEDIADGATAFKCAPPIRERAHRERLWQALDQGDIDLIASDHSPAPAALKCLEEGDFLRAWGGVASLQLAFAIVWTGAKARGIPIERVVGWMAEGPAALAGLAAAKGRIAPGADADLVFWDPDAESRVDPAKLHHRHPVTPYAGMVLHGQVRRTLLRGRIVFEDGEIMSGVEGRLTGPR